MMVNEIRDRSHRHNLKHLIPRPCDGRIAERVLPRASDARVSERASAHRCRAFENFHQREATLCDVRPQGRRRRVMLFNSLFLSLGFPLKMSNNSNSLPL